MSNVIPFTKKKQENKKKCSFCGKIAKVIENTQSGKCICYKCVAHASQRLKEED